MISCNSGGSYIAEAILGISLFWVYNLILVFAKRKSGWRTREVRLGGDSARKYLGKGDIPHRMVPRKQMELKTNLNRSIIMLPRSLVLYKVIYTSSY